MKIVVRGVLTNGGFVDVVTYICHAITGEHCAPFYGDVSKARHLFKKSKFWGETWSNVVRLQVASDIHTFVEAQRYKYPWFTLELALDFLEAVIKLKESSRAAAHRIWVRSEGGVPVRNGGIHTPLFNTVTVGGQELIL